MSLSSKLSLLNEFRDAYQGPVIVSGTGPSAREFSYPPGVPVIGVNRIAEFHVPDFLVIRDQIKTFKDATLDGKTILVGSAHYEDLVRKLPDKKDRIIPFQAVFASERRVVPQYHGKRHPQLAIGVTATLTALHFAGFLGATHIGMIGVDIIGHSQLDARLGMVNGTYKKLCAFLEEDGVEVINLSEQSRVTAFRKGTLDELLVHCGGGAGGQAVVDHVDHG